MLEEIAIQSLQKKKGFWETILSSLTDGVVVADLDGKLLFFNSAAEKILGIGTQDLNPTQWTDVYGCHLPDEVTPYPPDQLPLSRALRGEEVLDERSFTKSSGARFSPGSLSQGR